MEKHLLLVRAAPVTRQIVTALDDADLAAPTPCAGWDVRALVEHLLHWGPSLEGAAHKASVPPGAADAGDDWRKALLGQYDRLADAWGAPAAWEGTTYMGPTELPADLVGGMVLGEFVLHGWDLARAAGQAPAWDDEVLTALHAEVARSADQARSMGVYGAEVPVPETAPLLARVLGLSGRNPSWTA
ncbi:TIGR03086 family metal-binding protein [Dactylosporangium fulvum]|uniref:TIGR03086 family metal-binding protein n=1 Tax=Dactylosporangium fulvum TaxID=53359 RepID=A0ABY5W677_9ACTN|nr:TIGR03086 family metal-binding protein [Dactylosporangium fulvum]UWP84860.1 TIGR03086 family metal-binding protein [Dactylosporangium fulvum]